MEHGLVFARTSPSPARRAGAKHAAWMNAALMGRWVQIWIPAKWTVDPPANQHDIENIGKNHHGSN